MIDEFTLDELLAAGHDSEALAKARTLVDGFRSFIEANKDEIEALQVFYSRPRRAGLRYRQVKELAAALKRPPLSATPEGLWRAYEAVEPANVRGRGGKQLADVIALVRHALAPGEALTPYANDVEARYEQWLQEQEREGRSFTPDQCEWLIAIKDHIATSLRIEREDLEEAPFVQMGGLGRVYRCSATSFRRYSTS